MFVCNFFMHALNGQPLSFLLNIPMTVLQNIIVRLGKGAYGNEPFDAMRLTKSTYNNPVYICSIHRGYAACCLCNSFVNDRTRSESFAPTLCQYVSFSVSKCKRIS